MNPCKKTIEWADYTANPITGCYGPGGSPSNPNHCDYCYARRMAARFSKVSGSPYRRLLSCTADAFTPAFHWDVYRRLNSELESSRRPRRIFFGSMSDPGYEGGWSETDRNGVITGIDSPLLPHSEVKGLIEHLALKHPRHMFLLLTKNPAGLRGCWPRNVHIGTTVTTNQEAWERIPQLFHGVEAGLRWISVEPLVDPQLDPSLLLDTGAVAGVDWLVIGARTGPGAVASPELTETAKRIVERCRAIEHRTPVFVKANMRRTDPEFDWPTEIPN